MHLTISFAPNAGLIKYITVLLFLLPACITKAQDTLYVNSLNDKRLRLYNDSLTAYNVGYDVAHRLAYLFEELTGTKDYNHYFTNAWEKTYLYGEPVDTLLGYSEYLPATQLPNSRINNFASSSPTGLLIQAEIRRLDSLRVKPIGKVVGAELPVSYVYTKPVRVVFYQGVADLPPKAKIYTTIEPITHFMVNKEGASILPYNIKRYFENGKLIKTEYVDPLNPDKVVAAPAGSAP